MNDQQKLYDAASEGNVQEIEKLMELNKSNVDIVITSNKSTPLMVACFFGNYEVAKSLLHHGADVNKENNNGDTPLITVCKKKNPTQDDLDIIKMLIKNGAELNKKNKTGVSAKSLIDLEDYPYFNNFLGGKRRKTNKRKTNKRKTNKRKTNKRKRR
uniref:Uncharacterized protein n=1 Tax=viral metagenome TaxID=1070528 RepID=A0A6C0IEV0_9ZZZZ